MNERAAGKGSSGIVCKTNNPAVSIKITTSFLKFTLQLAFVHVVKSYINKVIHCSTMANRREENAMSINNDYY